MSVPSQHPYITELGHSRPPNTPVSRAFARIGSHFKPGMLESAQASWGAIAPNASDEEADQIAYEVLSPPHRRREYLAKPLPERQSTLMRSLLANDPVAASIMAKLHGVG